MYIYLLEALSCSRVIVAWSVRRRGPRTSQRLASSISSPAASTVTSLAGTSIYSQRNRISSVTRRVSQRVTDSRHDAAGQYVVLQ